MNPETIKNPNRSRAPGYFLILLGINIAVELRGMTPKQEIKNPVIPLYFFQHFSKVADAMLGITFSEWPSVMSIQIRDSTMHRS